MEKKHLSGDGVDGGFHRTKPGLPKAGYGPKIFDFMAAARSKNRGMTKVLPDYAGIPTGDPIIAHDWVRKALQCLTVGQQPLLYTQQSVKTLPRHGRGNSQVWKEHPNWPQHKHTTTQLCLSLSGESVLNIEGRRFLFTPPKLAVIGPNVLHSEGRRFKGDSYALLWMFCVKSSIHLVVSSHSPGRVWKNPWMYSFCDESVTTLNGSMEDFVVGKPEAGAAFGADLVCVLAAAYRRLALDKQAGEDGNKKSAMLNHMKLYLDDNLDKPIPLRQLSAMFNFTPKHLNGLFHEWRGKGIHAYLIEQRMEKAIRLCKRTNLAVKEIAAKVGYNDALYFSKAFHTYHGVWPSELAKLARYGRG